MAFGPFNLLPLGLPNLFGLTGQSMPKALLEDMRLTLDSLPFLAGPNCQEVLQNSVNVNAVGLQGWANFQVPDTEAWLVHGFSISAAVGAAEVLRFRPVIGKALAAGNIVQQVCGAECASSLTDAAGAANLRAGITGDFVLWPGEFLAFAVHRITTAGSISCFGQATIYRFTI